MADNSEVQKTEPRELVFVSKARSTGSPPMWTLAMHLVYPQMLLVSYALIWVLPKNMPGPSSMGHLAAVILGMMGGVTLVPFALFMMALFYAFLFGGEAKLRRRARGVSCISCVALFLAAGFLEAVGIGWVIRSIFISSVLAGPLLIPTFLAKNCKEWFGYSESQITFVDPSRKQRKQQQPFNSRSRSRDVLFTPDSSGDVSNSSNESIVGND